LSCIQIVRHDGSKAYGEAGRTHVGRDARTVTARADSRVRRIRKREKV
jgi:hypothetical protein